MLLARQQDMTETEIITYKHCPHCFRIIEFAVRTLAVKKHKPIQSPSPCNLIGPIEEGKFPLIFIGTIKSALSIYFLVLRIFSF